MGKLGRRVGGAENALPTGKTSKFVLFKLTKSKLPLGFAWTSESIWGLPKAFYKANFPLASGFHLVSSIMKDLSGHL